MAFSLSLRGRLAVLVGAGALALVASVAATRQIMDRVQIGSRTYLTLVASRDLIAAMAPSSLSLVEARLAAEGLAAADDARARDSLLLEFRRLAQEHEARLQAVGGTSIAPDVAEVVARRVGATAAGFFALADSVLLPAVRRGDRAAATAVAAGPLRAAYERHQAEISDALVLATSRTAEEERRVTALRDRQSRRIWGAAAVALTCLGLLGWWIAARTVGPLRAAVRVLEGAVEGDFARHLDARDLRSAPDEVRRMAEALNVAVDALGRTLAAQAAARRAAEDAARTKDEFLARMSHEFRTPLNHIIGHAGLLAMLAPRSAEERDALETIERSGRALVSLVEDVLDAAALEGGSLVLADAPFSLAALFDRLEAEARPLAAARGLDFDARVDLAPDVIAVGDGQRLHRLLAHLLQNALKFTEAGRIRLRARSAADEAGVRLRVSITDTGPGLGGAVAGGRIAPFRQGDGGPARRHGGAGLGLALCHGLASRMGGTLRLEDAEGGGTRVTVSLPLRSLPRAADPRAA